MQPDTRNIILSTIGGLLVGTIGALAYSHIVDGNALADLQAQLNDANAALATANKSKQNDAKFTSSASDQINQLSQDNADLRKQLADAKAAPTDSAQGPTVNPALAADLMRAMMRGGMMQGQMQMFLLKTRLKLTPDQEAKIKAAMDADQKARFDIMRQMRQNGGKVDPALAASANTLDATLKSVLTPQQQSDYEKVQADEKNSRADTTASTLVNNLSPLLQLSDSQKDQAMNAVYQVQMAAPDPKSMLTDPNPMNAFTSQADKVQAALAKVLTPDQLALYNAQAASFNFGGGRRGGNGGGQAAGGAAPPAPPPPQ